MAGILQTGFLISIIGIVIVFLVLSLIWLSLELVSRLLDAQQRRADEAAATSSNISIPHNPDIEHILKKAIAVHERLDESCIHIIQYKTIGYNEIYSHSGGSAEGSPGSSAENQTRYEKTTQTVPMPDSQTGSEGSSEDVPAPMPGKILKLTVSSGQQVRKGDIICVLEAMKMENEIPSPSDGIISEVHVSEGQNVKNGDLLVSIK